MQVAATADVEMANHLGAVVADEGMAIGCNWAFAPVIDIDINPDNPMTNIRTFGSNPELVGAMGKAYVGIGTVSWHGCFSQALPWRWSGFP